MGDGAAWVWVPGLRGISSPRHPGAGGFPGLKLPAKGGVGTSHVGEFAFADPRLSLSDPVVVPKATHLGAIQARALSSLYLMDAGANAAAPASIKEPASAATIPAANIRAQVRQPVGGADRQPSSKLPSPVASAVRGRVRQSRHARRGPHRRAGLWTFKDLRKAVRRGDARSHASKIAASADVTLVAWRRAPVKPPQNMRRRNTSAEFCSGSSRANAGFE